MALKFRRGNNAQKSGSLAFGEPYVNTSLGTLQIGLDTGDVTLQVAGTSSIGSFGAITGTSLNISGDAEISGNLTLGGNITIGDQTNDTVVVSANLSSSLIPANDNTFDLGAGNKRYRDAFIGRNLKVDGNTTLGDSSSDSVIFSASLASDIIPDGTATRNLGSAQNPFRHLYVSTGSIFLIGASGNVEQTIGVAQGNSLAVPNNLQIGGNFVGSGSASSLFLRGNATITGSVSASTFVGLGNLTEYSTSVDARLTALVAETTALEAFTASASGRLNNLELDSASQDSRLDNLESTTASLNTSVSSINTFSASTLSRLTSLEFDSASQDARLDLLEGFTGSQETKNNTLATYTGSVNDKFLAVQSSTASLNSFTASIDTTIKNKLNTDAVLSGSAQIVAGLPTNTVSASSDTANVDITITAGVISADLRGGVVSGSAQVTSLLPTGVISGSSQLTNEFDTRYLNTNGDSVVSGSSQIDATQTTNWASGIKTQLNSNTVVSGSAQVTSLLPTGVVSGSSQIDATATTNWASGIKTQLNVNAVVSGSGQLTALLPTNVVSSSNDTANVDITINSGVISADLRGGVVSGSSQIDATATTNWATGIKTQLNSNTVVSGSAQVVGILSSLNSYTASNDTTNTNQNDRLSSLENYSSSLKTAITVAGSNVTVNGNLTVAGTTTAVNSTTVQIGDNIIELNGTGAANGGLRVKDPTAPNTVSGSLLWDSTNDYWVAGPAGAESKILLAGGDGVISGSGQLTAALPTNVVSASTDTANVDITITAGVISANLMGGVVSGSAQVTSLLPTGVISGSSQVDATATTNWATGIKTQLNTNTVVSGSSQITYNNITGIPAGIVSGAAQVTPLLPTGTISGSSQVTYNNITGIPTGIVSGAAQITSLLPTGTISGSAQVNGTQITNNTITIAGTPTALGGTITLPTITGGSGIISGSGQLTATLPAGVVSASADTATIDMTINGGTISAVAIGGIVSGSSQVVGILSSLNSYTASNNTNISNLQNETTLLEAFTASAAGRLNNLEITSASVNTSINNINASTASLNSFTSSINTTIKNRLNAETVISGSSQVNGTQIQNNTITIAGTSTALGGTITLPTITGGSGIISGAAQLTSTLPTNVVSASSDTATIDMTIANGTVSAVAIGGIVSSSTQVQNYNTFALLNSANTFNGNQIISGTLTVTQNLTVLGSSSIQNISSSTLNIGTNLITVAVNQPSVRFGGLAVIDSGSANASGSFLYDSVQDEFIFVHRGDGVNITSSHFVLGPETYNNLGNETYLTNNRLPKGTGKEHIVDSNITDNGTTITLGSNTVVTGTLSATGTTLVSGSSQISYTGLSNIPAGIVSGAAQVTALLPTGVVSGSSQLTASYDVRYETRGQGIISSSAQISALGLLPVGSSASVGFPTYPTLYSISPEAGKEFSTYSSIILGVGAGRNTTTSQDIIALGQGAATDAGHSAYTVFIGQQAGSLSTGSSGAVYIGQQAGDSAVNNDKTVAIGMSAGMLANESVFSVMLGASAGDNVVSGSYSSFIGNYAGAYSINALNSNFIGYSAGGNTTNANQANFIGYTAGQGADGTYNSNFIGYTAGTNASGAYQSNFIGLSAGYGATGANMSNFIGMDAGEYAVDTKYSTFIGHNAGKEASYVTSSIFIGNNAGYQAVSSSNSILIGHGVGYKVLFQPGIGPNNIIIGNNISLEGNRRDSINIGGLIFGTGSYADTTLGAPSSGSANGRIGINVPNPTHNFQVSGSVAFPSLTNSAQSNLVGYDTATGRLFYQSSAVGGVIATTGSTLYSVSPAAGNSLNTSRSIFFGTGAGNNTTGSLGGAYDSIFLGTNSGWNASEAWASNFIGQYAGSGSTNAHSSNFIGREAGIGVTDSSFSNFIGFQAGRNATTAASSNFIGAGAGNGAISASYSTIIGTNAGKAHPTGNGVGTNNIIIGSNVSLPNGRRDSINLGGIIFATGSHSNMAMEALTGSAGGRVGINVVTPTHNFEVSGSVALTSLTNVQQSNVVGYDTATGRLFYQSSAGTVSGSAQIITGTSGQLLYASGSGSTLVAKGSSRLQFDEATGRMTVGGGLNTSYQLYVTTSLNDASVGIDSSAPINAIYLLKDGVKNFEMSFDSSPQPVTNGIFRLMPYMSNTHFEIGNPSNASGFNTDYIFVSENTYGNVMIGPGLPNGIGNLDGAVAATDKVQIRGNMFISGSTTARGHIIPTTSNLYDLGSAAKPWRDLYVSTGSIFLIGAGGNVEQTIGVAAGIGLAVPNGIQFGGNLVGSGSASSLFLRGDATITGSVSASTFVGLGNLTTYSSSVASRLALLEVETANLESFTSSINTTIKTRLNAETVISGSSQVLGGSGIVSGAAQVTPLLPTGTVSGSSQVVGILTSLNSYTASNNTNISNLQNETTLLEAFTASAAGRLTSIESYTSSLRTALTVAGSDVTVNGNLTVAGTTTTVNSTTLQIADNIIQLNGTGATNAGLVVRDATAATTVSGSLLWDTANDKWIAGPLGSEDDVVLRTLGQTLTNKTISGASNTLTNIGNASLTNSTITIAGTSTALGGSITLATITGGSGIISGSGQLPVGVVSGSSQITYSGITGIPAGIVSGAAQVTPLLPTGTVSGSSQVVGILTSLNSYTASNNSNISALQNETTLLEAFTASAASRLTVLESETANLELFTSSINTTIKAQLNANTVISGSSQVTGIANSQLTNSTITIAGTSTALGGSITLATITGGSGIVSGSSQVTYSSLTGIPAGIVSGAAQITPLLPTGTISGSSQVTGIGNSQLTNSSLTINGTSVSLGGSATIPNLVSGSAQISGTGITNNTITIAGTSTALGGTITLATITGGSGIVSGSGQVTYSSLSGIPAGIVSGAAQVTALLPTGTVSGSSQVYSGVSGDITIASNGVATIAANSVALGTDTTGNYMSNVSAGNAGIVISHTQGEGSTATISLVGGVVSGSAQIDVSSTTGDIALGTRTSGNYVATITAGTGVSSTGATTGEGIAHTISIGQAVGTSDNVRFGSIGVGMAASGTSGRIDAAGDVVAFSTSDIRFKENIKAIENPIQKIRQISGNTYDWKAELKVVHGFEGNDVGVIAQEVEAVLPQLVTTRENGYKAVKYDKLVALLIEGMKEQQLQIEKLQIEVADLKKQKGL